MLLGNEMDVIIRHHHGGAIHSDQELAAMSSPQIAQHYELIGINSQHRKAILYAALKRELKRDHSDATDADVDEDPRAIWLAKLYSPGVIFSYLILIFC